MARFLQARLHHQRLHGRGGLPHLVLRCPRCRTEYFAEPDAALPERRAVVLAAEYYLAGECPDHGHAFTLEARGSAAWACHEGVRPVGDTWRTAVYISRLSFYTRPGQTEAVAKRLEQLADLVVASGLSRPRVLRMSMASPGAPDLQFEEEFSALSELERSMQEVVAADKFRAWSEETSALLLQPPKREILTIS
jgi:hypothetical protein